MTSAPMTGTRPGEIHAAAGAAGRVGCCIAGCGPAGAMLGLLLARAGVDVLVLEKHGDFLRDFRGDTIHPSTLEILDELGLAERFLRLPHTEVSALAVRTPAGDALEFSLRRLKTTFPFIAFVPQWDFLDFVTREAARYPGFRLRMRAEVVDLIADGGIREVRALLAVGAEGRVSPTRAAAGLRVIATAPPMDVLWFRMPRRPGPRRHPDRPRRLLADRLHHPEGRRGPGAGRRAGRLPPRPTARRPIRARHVRTLRVRPRP
jgi:2-polyprenyl-6-methoxyphenol hydroxylase-like FAD-dependent oxidoreductase